MLRGIYSAFYGKVNVSVSVCVEIKVKVKVKQSRYRPGVAQRVPGS
jgi:hypothetical protein